MESQIVLRDILEGQRKTLEEFLAATPLSCCDGNRTVLAAILPSHPSLNAKPESGGEIGYVLKVARPLSEMWFHLPSSLEYKALRIVAVDPVVHFEIDTTERTTRTNMQELARKMADWVVTTEPERKGAFDGLSNEYEAPVPKPKRKSFTSKILGQVTPGRFEGTWESKPAPVPYFDGQVLPIGLYDVSAGHVGDIDAALTNFLALGAGDRNAVAPLVLANCHDFLEAIGAETEQDRQMASIADASEIWRHVDCRGLDITRDDSQGEPSIYISLLCECEWEDEHGLQIVYRNGKTLSRVSAQDGCVIDS